LILTVFSHKLAPGETMTESPNIAQSLYRRSTCVRVIVIVTVCVIAALTFVANPPDIRITNTSPSFSVISVKVSRGTNHVSYFPGRFSYWRMRIAGQVNAVLPKLKLNEGLARKMQIKTGKDVPLFWILFVPARLPGLPGTIMLPGGEMTYSAQSVCDTTLNRGMLCIRPQQNITNLTGMKLEFSVSDGVSTIEFR
jgi:hypothetical protein